MTQPDSEKVRLRRQGSKWAIALAMQGRWREAVAANKSLIESFPNDVDAYNRLGRAYMELSEYSQAREAYRQAIELDPYNAIAKKNLQRLSILGESAAAPQVDSQGVEPEQFIEEVGKAGIVNLHRLAPAEVLARMVAGDKVNLKTEGTNLIVENNPGEYLGQVEPKHGQRLVKLMEGGNKYAATILNSMEDRISVIIREVYQDPSQEGRLSFPPKGMEGPHPYVSDRLLRHELEYEEALPEEPGYTIIGGDEREVLPEESLDAEDEAENEE